MVSLAQKLKLLKTCEKRLYKLIRMDLRKTPLQKRANNQKISRFEDLAKMATLQRHRLCKMVSLAQKLKLLETCEKRLYKLIRMDLRKKPLQKRADNQKISRFEYLAKMATLQRL